MSDDKICPFMSRPDGTSNTDGSPRVAAVYCQKERCAAWGEKERLPTRPVIGCRLIP